MGLGGGDKAQDVGRGDPGEIAAERHRRLPDLGAKPAPGRLMRLSADRLQPGMDPRPGLCGQKFRPRPGQRPGPAIMAQRHVDLPEMRAEIARHHGGCPVQQGLAVVLPGVLRIGKDHMGMAKHHRIRPGKGREGQPDIFGPALGPGFGSGGADAGMGQKDDDIRPRIAQRPHLLRGGKNGVFGRKVPVDRAGLPLDRLRRGDPGDADPDRAARAIGGGHAAFDHDGAVDQRDIVQ